MAIAKCVARFYDNLVAVESLKSNEFFIRNAFAAIATKLRFYLPSDHDCWQRRAHLIRKSKLKR